MALKYPGVRRTRLLNDAGQRLIEQAFERRTRSRGGFHDMADAYIRALDDHGLLTQYLLDGVAPYEVLEWKAETGGRYSSR
jgi:hypothetical protein